MIDELAARRFDRVTDPSDCSFDELFAAVQRHIVENGADHIVICCGKRADGRGSKHSRFQAGDYTHHEIVGMLSQVQHDMMAG